MKLETENIILRKLKSSDASSLAQHANDRQVSKYLRYTFPYPYKLKDAKEFIRRTQKDWRGKNVRPFGIEFKETGEIIGVINFHAIRHHAKEAEIGYWIGKEFWHQGLGTEALSLLLQYGFKELKLNRISACAYAPNKASQKLLKKLGFKKEGQLRQYTVRDGKYLDQMMFGILKKEFKK